MTNPLRWLNRHWHDARVRREYRDFCLRHAGRPTPRALPTDRPLKVCHVSPTYFADESHIGGGERVPSSLARAMAADADVTLVSFGPRRSRTAADGCTIDLFPLPSAWATFETEVLAAADALQGFDVVHCHQFNYLLTAAAARAGRAGGAHLFVTDHGGADARAARMVEQSVGDISGLLAMSAFSLRNLPAELPHRVIFGGVDEPWLTVTKAVVEPRILYIGRITPHKGIDVLINAMPEDVLLEIHGRPYHAEYLELLHRLSQGKQVKFHTDSSDADLRAALSGATALVLPSVYRDCYGGAHRLPELLGLVLLEAMATGTPVVCSAVGGMPEIVHEGVTGFIVPPGDTLALKAQLCQLIADPTLARSMGERGRAEVDRLFTWPSVAARCLEAYRDLADAAESSLDEVPA